MNPLTLDARGIRTDWPKEHLQTQAGLQENQHANRRKEESMSSASRKWIICKTMCRMNQLGSMKLMRSILTPPKWARGACVNEILWLPWIYQSKFCNLQLCFGQKCLSWSCKNQNCPDTKGSMWLLSEKKKKKVPLEASLSQVQRMTPTGSSRAPLNTTNNGISLEAQQPRSSLTSQCLVFL